MLSFVFTFRKACLVSDLLSTARRALPARLIHAGLAVSIVTQLMTSLVMCAPHGTTPGDIVFEIHEYSGYTALAFATLFRRAPVVRSEGPAAGSRVP